MGNSNGSFHSAQDVENNQNGGKKKESRFKGGHDRATQTKPDV